MRLVRKYGRVGFRPLAIALLAHLLLEGGVGVLPVLEVERQLLVGHQSVANCILEYQHFLGVHGSVVQGGRGVLGRRGMVGNQDGHGNPYGFDRLVVKRGGCGGGGGRSGGRGGRVGEPGCLRAGVGGRVGVERTIWGDYQGV